MDTSRFSQCYQLTENLRKVLELERARGFADSAVLGGLDGYLRRLLKRSLALLDRRLTTAMSALPVGGYASLPSSKRRRWLEELLAIIHDRSAGAQPAPRVKP